MTHLNCGIHCSGGAGLSNSMDYRRRNAQQSVQTSLYPLLLPVLLWWNRPLSAGIFELGCLLVLHLLVCSQESEGPCDLSELMRRDRRITCADFGVFFAELALGGFVSPVANPMLGPSVCLLLRMQVLLRPAPAVCNAVF